MSESSGVGRLDDIRKLQDRTKRFAVAVIRFYAELPQNEPPRVIGRQLLRSNTSVAAIPFNGLSVVAGGIHTAAILADENLRRLTLELMDEVISIANQCGHALPTAAALEQMKRTETMGAHKSSTLIDYLAGRRLEIEAIWGEPYRRARAAGVAAPLLENLYQQLLLLDRAQRSKSR